MYVCACGCESEPEIRSTARARAFSLGSPLALELYDRGTTAGVADQQLRRMGGKKRPEERAGIWIGCARIRGPWQAFRSVSGLFQFGKGKLAAVTRPAGGRERQQKRQATNDAATRVKPWPGGEAASS